MFDNLRRGFPTSKESDEFLHEKLLYSVQFGTVLALLKSKGGGGFEG